MSRQVPGVSVIICAYTESRWDALIASIESVMCQIVSPLEIIVVIDHNQKLLEAVRNRFPELSVVENLEAKGLSGARNTGIGASRYEVVAFIDDDAIAAPGWLAILLADYSDPRVVGVGGSIDPLWVEGRPRWFPDEFNWVVGCTYRGMPQKSAPVRNLIGCNMSFRRSVFQAVGGFRHGIGRVDSRPFGCEETEFCIRLSGKWPQSLVLYRPEARVLHNVPSSRANARYYVSRCYSEGFSKALVSKLVGVNAGLSCERTYTFRTLPHGLIRGILGGFINGDMGSLLRACTIVMGLAITSVGYVAGTVSQLTGRSGHATDSHLSPTSVR